MYFMSESAARLSAHRKEYIVAHIPGAQRTENKYSCASLSGKGLLPSSFPENLSD